MLGITKAKKRLKKELGITAAMKPFRWRTHTKRRLKRKIGYESKAGRLFANAYPFVRVFFYENTIKDGGGYPSLCRPHVLAKHFDKWPLSCDSGCTWQPS